LNRSPTICRGNRSVVGWLVLRGTRRARPRGRNWVFSSHGA
jgi:hypothetical protein